MGSHEREVDLTAHQARALESRLRLQKGRYFSGMSLHTIANSFSQVNELRKKGSPAADVRERELFNLCDYTPQTPAL